MKIVLIFRGRRIEIVITLSLLAALFSLLS
jgi:hypothetical protein